MSVGDTVLYTMLHDGVIAPAVVVAVHAQSMTVDLFVMFQGGVLHKERISQGAPGVPETWHPKA